MSHDDTHNYNPVSRVFHWLVAVLILGLIPVGFYMEQMSSSPLKFEIYGWHKSLGISVLLLAFLRVGWKIYKKPPSSLTTHKCWEKLLSKTIHIVLYIAIFVMPLSGWVMSNSGGYAVQFFGLFEMPKLVEKDKFISDLARSVHEIAGFVVMGCVGFHVVGALKHHYSDKDATLTRMGGRPVVGFIAILVLLLTVGVVVRGALVERQVKVSAAAVSDAP